jgi:hypothetical protein
MTTHFSLLLLLLIHQLISLALQLLAVTLPLLVRQALAQKINVGALLLHLPDISVDDLKIFGFESSLSEIGQSSFKKIYLARLSLRHIVNVFHSLVKRLALDRSFRRDARDAAKELGHFFVD